MSFPSPPWTVRGQVWLSLFYATPPGGPRGSYVAAYLLHEAGSTLRRRELLVARRHREDGERRLTVIAGWSDSAPAVEGGSALWGLPMAAGSLVLDAGGLGPVGRASWTASSADGRPVASAQFADTAGVVLRTPVRARVGSGSLRGSGRTVPCLGAWEVDPDAPLAWLARKQPLASFRIRDARLDLS